MRALKTCLVALAAAAAGHANAAIVYDANVTNNVIFGSGVTNGAFTVDRSASGVEVGLRGKVRFDVSDDLPKNVFNSNGDGTYSHAAGAPAASPSRSRWNFEWSVNSNYDGSGSNLAGLTYTIGMDFDASAAKNYVTLDLLSLPGFDHSFGNNGTAMGAGAEGNAQTLATTNNLMQNSWSLDFFDTPSLLPLVPSTFNPNADGEYSFFLQAARGNDVIARTEITVIVGDGAAVPEPGSLALAGLALLGAVGALRRRRH